MSSLNDFFIQYGYLGMFFASFLAGSFVPFSSEAVMSVLLIATDMNPIFTVLAATLGNVLGSIFNYGLGRMGNADTISRWLKIAPHRLEQAQRWADRYGVWLGFFAFLPIIGTAIAVVLGLMRANFWGTSAMFLLGKLLRYILVAGTAVALS
ncbi:MAG: DedA family protein [Prevotellaceae bacterium]|nr:DedA family protein [Prevotellaceae bacterium]